MSTPFGTVCLPRPSALVALTFLCVLCFGLGGCGLGREAEFHLLVADNTPAPPGGTLLKKEVYTQVVMAIPTVYVTYSSQLSEDELFEFYYDRLRAKGWNPLTEPPLPNNRTRVLSLHASK